LWSWVAQTQPDHPHELFIIPSGGTVLEAGDSILTLVNKENLPRVRAALSEVAAQDARM